MERRINSAVIRLWPQIAATAVPLYAEGGQPDVVEFSDYQCPYCRAAEPAVDSVLARGIRVAVVHLPLTIHPSARPAALVAICAQEVGQFSQVHSFLLATTAWQSGSDSLSRAGLSAAVDAQALTDLLDCVQQHRADGALKRHLALADSIQPLGTPLFVSARGVLVKPVSAASLAELARAGGR